MGGLRLVCMSNLHLVQMLYVQKNILFQGEFHCVLVVSRNHDICFPSVIDLLQHVLQTSGQTTRQIRI